MSADDSAASEKLFRVVRNGEGQYSVWADDRELPSGWESAGPTGSRAACLAYIQEHWTDIRPLSVRQRLAGDAISDPG